MKESIVFDIVDNFTVNENDNDTVREENEKDNETINVRAENEGALPTTIYRFKFTEDFMTELYNFSKIHQYDHRKDFKEAWVKWTEVHQNIIDSEIERLRALGYQNEDDIVDDKMFKSARYYFRKKNPIRAEPKQRRQYIGVDHELLETMDNHIIANIYNEDYKPKTAFVLFCKENETILKKTIMKMSIQDAKLIQEKIKKTYKNRYFMLTTK
jgi:hypothetical protein